MGSDRRWFWAVTLLVAVIALLFCWKFRYAVFAGDMGVKYLQAMTFQRGPLQLDYPGERFDPTGDAFPFEPPVIFLTPVGWMSVWLNPMVLFLVPLFDRLFSWAGYLMAPFLGGLLTISALTKLGKELHLPKPDLSGPLVWIATPLLFYSLVLWEHTLAVGCGLMGLASLLGAVRGRKPPFRAGLWLGVSSLFRPEAALAAGILCLSIWVVRWRRVEIRSFILWGVASVLPPILWGSLVSWLAVAPTTAQIAFPYLSPYSPWSGNEWGRHGTKMLQTLVEPYQDASFGDLAGASSILILMIVGFAIPRSIQNRIPIAAGLFLLLGAILVGVQLTAQKVFYSGILAACPAMAVVAFLPRRPQTRLLLWAWLVGLIVLTVIAPNNGGLQRGCRYLLLPCVLGVFLVISEMFRTRGATKAIMGLVLLLGVVVQAQGGWVLWYHKSSKETSLQEILSEQPDFVLTSVWYFPQEAGRIYPEVPILWGRTDPQIQQILVHTESLDPKPGHFIAVLPSQSSDRVEIDLPRWKGTRVGDFGSLPVFRFMRQEGEGP